MTQVNLLNYWKTASYTKQKPPFKKPLPYECTYIHVTDRYSRSQTSPNAVGTMGAWCGSFDNYYCPSSYSACYEKFFSKVKSQSNWGENLATYKETFNLAGELFGACRSPLKEIAKLYRKAKKDWGAPLRSVNGAYLSYVYGLHPLVSDLESTCTLLEEGIPPQHIQERASTRGNESKIDSNGWHYYWKVSATTRMDAYVLVDNPNLASFAAAGLANPLALAWDLIPFSFVFDQVYNIGSWLHGLDSLFGLRLEDSFYTRTYRFDSFDQWQKEGNGMNGCKGSAFHMVRTVGGLPSPPPYVDLKLSKWQLVHDLSLMLGLAAPRSK